MSSRQSNQFPIPESFPEILHNFAKEIVRYKPNDIYDFSIQYFYCLENEIPLNYTPGASSNIHHKEDKNKETLIEDNNTNKINNNNIINNEDVNDNINENSDDNIDEHYEKKAKEFIDDVLKKSFQFVQNEINENKIENEEDEKSINKNSSEDNNIENNEMNQEILLTSENNEEGNEENVILGKTVMNTQGSESNSRAFSASSISNNSEIRRTAHQFIGDVLKNGREDAKKNQDII
jgi:hypothetical protein